MPQTPRASRSGRRAKRFWHATAGLVAALTASRLLVAANVGLGDAEAYYWAWSEHLSAGYLDHGPMVAFVIRASTTLLGQTPLGVRAPFILISAASLLLIACVTARAARQWPPALLAVAVVLSMPMFLIAGGAANPDVPFVGTVALLMWLAHAAGPRPGPGWAAVAGLTVGLAISTKLFGLALIGMPLLMAWQSRRRPTALLLACSGAFAGALPWFLWNAAHRWPTLQYHLMDRHTQPAGPSLLNLGKLVGGQLAYVSPWTLTLLAVAAAHLWGRRRDPLHARMLALAAPLILGGYLLILCVPSAEPHWPAAGYLPLVPCAAAWLYGAWSGSRKVRGLTWTAVGLTVIISMLFHLHILTDWGVRLMPASYVPRYDLSNELRGWPQVADRVATRSKRKRDVQSDRPLAVTGCHYTACAQLRFAARNRFATHCVSPRIDQFDFFEGGDGEMLLGRDLLYLWDERFPFEARQLYCCDRVQGREPIVVRRAGRVVRRFGLELCEGFCGLRARRWPPLAKRGNSSAPKSAGQPIPR